MTEGRRRYSLRVDLEDFGSETGYAQYAHFSIGSEKDNFTLHVGGYSGTAGKCNKCVERIYKMLPCIKV